MKLRKKMLNKIILASKSKVRKKILEENGISCEIKPANIDEDLIKESLLKEGATPDIISKNLAELKNYLLKIKDDALYAYNVYQIEGEGRSLFSKIEGDVNTIMGLPIKKINEYLKNL